MDAGYLGKRVFVVFAARRSVVCRVRDGFPASALSEGYAGRGNCS